MTSERRAYIFIIIYIELTQIRNVWTVEGKKCLMNYFPNGFQKPLSFIQIIHFGTDSVDWMTLVETEKFCEFLFKCEQGDRESRTIRWMTVAKLNQLRWCDTIEKETARDRVNK